MKMKYKYILAAAHGWNEELAMDLLPPHLPEYKLTDIGMAPPLSLTTSSSPSISFSCLRNQPSFGAGSTLVRRDPSGFPRGFARLGSGASMSRTAPGFGHAPRSTFIALRRRTPQIPATKTALRLL